MTVEQNRDDHQYETPSQGAWRTAPRGLAERVAEILRANLRLTPKGGEPCVECGETIDYVYKVKDGCIEQCASDICDLVFGAIASGDISASVTPKGECHEK